MAWIAIFIPIVVAIILLFFFRKNTTFWEIGLLIAPSALLILLMNFIMVSSNESDTEYRGSYVTKVIYYQAWDERVHCRHSYDCHCSTDKNGHRSCSTCYEHAYDVDFHPECWSKVTNTGAEYGISKQHFLELQKQFATQPYFVDMHRDYHSIDGDAYYTDWNKKPETSDIVTTEHSYKNKVMASHSIFKFDVIDEKTKKIWGLYDYPKLSGLYQSMVLGHGVNYATDKKLQYLNGYYGVNKQFRMYILFFKDQSIEAAFKQRSYWEGGNKNEFVVCIGTNALGQYKWNKCFSWMDKPDLEVRVQDWLNDEKNNHNLDLNKFADWMPKQIEQHWQRKRFRDFEYLNVEISGTQLMWILIIIGIYNIGMCIWIVMNEFKNEHD
jgi:hypothetical protein